MVNVSNYNIADFQCQSVRPEPSESHRESVCICVSKRQFIRKILLVSLKSVLRDDESTSPHLPFWLFWPPPQKRKIYILKISKKSPTILIVISYNLKPVKISYANGRVSVRIFYKNNLINASSKSESRFIKLIRKKSIIQGDTAAGHSWPSICGDYYTPTLRSALWHARGSERKGERERARAREREREFVRNSVCFFVLCNRHLFNRIPGAHLGIACVYPAP